MAETVIRIEGASEGSESEAEAIQAEEHEAQEAEGEQWQNALSNVTQRLGELSELVATQGNRISPELQTLLETQREMIASLQVTSQTQAQQLQEIVDRYLLTQQLPPEPVTPIAMTPVEVPVEAPGGPEVLEAPTKRRYRGL